MKNTEFGEFKNALTNIGYSIQKESDRNYIIYDNYNTRTDLRLEKQIGDVYYLIVLKPAYHNFERERMASFSISELNVLSNGTLRVGSDTGYILLKKH
jgi:hypothetical protein